VSAHQTSTRRGELSSQPDAVLLLILITLDPVRLLQRRLGGLNVEEDGLQLTTGLLHQGEQDGLAAVVGFV